MYHSQAKTATGSAAAENAIQQPHNRIPNKVLQSHNRVRLVNSFDRVFHPTLGLPAFQDPPLPLSLGVVKQDNAIAR
jgi:hypothetical protein